MILNIAVVVLVLFIAYMWASQGLWSALLHFLCTLVAGAVALAVWEPLTNSLLLGLRQDISWSIGLMLPFLITLGLLRLATDKIIIANIDLDGASNFIGGGLFGLGSATISAGLLVISMGFLGLPPGFLGHRSIAYDTRGNLVRSSSLWYPADMLTTELYERLSLAGFGTATPLATRHPNLHEQASVIRATFDDRSRTTIARSDFQLDGRYTVEANSLDELLSDTLMLDDQGLPFPPQRAVTLDGEPYPPDSILRGYVMTFLPGAREKGGQVVFGPGQLRLVGVRSNGEAAAYHPIAVVTQAAGDELAFGRFRFDAQDVFVASVGAATEATMAFEFATPPDFEPRDLLVKNIRVSVNDFSPLPGAPSAMTPAERDEAIRTLGLVGRGEMNVEGAEPAVRPGAAPSDGGQTRVVSDAGARDSDIRRSSSLPFNFSRSDRGNLEINENNDITGGTHRIAQQQRQTSISPSLRVDSFATPGDTTMIQIDVGLDSKLSLFGRAAQAASDLAPPTLYDTLGQPYQAVGYVFNEGSYHEIRFTPGRTLRGLREIPQLSRSKPGQSLTLVFLVNRGVEIDRFALGNRTIVELDPPMPTR